MKIRKIILLIIVLGWFNLFGQKSKVLNLGVFHMGNTSDANKVKYDSDKSNVEIDAIINMLADFKPTMICVEIIPNNNEDLNKDYSNFLNDGKYKTKYKGEIEALAYKVAKISGVKTIYGIDDKETAMYNYNIGEELKNQVDSLTSRNYKLNLFKKFAKVESLSTLEKLIFFNSKETLEGLININADILAYNSTKGNFEGADEASKFYKRNLRIFSNLNQLPVTKDDRVLIIMGATHTAFLNEFLKRSPKYELVETSQYLKKNSSL
jgi:hypothetical protein